MSLAYHFHRVRRGISNFSLVKHRHAHGHLASMHQSGTHWLKFMLANAMAHHYGVPGPQFNHANDLIGGPRDVIRYPQLPRLLSAHSIPHPVQSLGLTHQCLRFPPYCVLVRDIRASLVSNFEKWRHRYDCSFEFFLRGDPAGRRYNSDVWWCFRFLNAWRGVRNVAPARVLVLRYEDLQADPAAGLRLLVEHFGLPLTAADLAFGIASSSKQVMSEKDDPARPQGAINLLERDPAGYFTPSAREWFSRQCERHLLDTWGYDYARWPASRSVHNSA